jgi:hypothetical protein
MLCSEKLRKLKYGIKPQFSLLRTQTADGISDALSELSPVQDFGWKVHHPFISRISHFLGGAAPSINRRPTRRDRAGMRDNHVEEPCHVNRDFHA